jgi:hypothetical protein
MAKALMLYYSFHEHVEKLEHEIAAGEDRFRKRRIIHSASGSYVRTDARRRVSEGNGSYADADQDDRCRRLEGLLPVKAAYLAGALRHRDRLRRGTLGAGFGYVLSDFRSFPK